MRRVQAFIVSIVGSEAVRGLPAAGRRPRQGTAFFAGLLCLLVLATVPAAARAGVDDYPANLKSAAKDALTDPWLFFNRECTSFVAWRLNSRNGIPFQNYYGGPQWGNANHWDDAARAAGIPVNGTPAVGAIAQTDAGSAGHVAWVESVNPGGTVTIEEYNHDNAGHYSERTVSAGSYVYIHVHDISGGGGGFDGWYELGFQANTGNLWTVGSDPHGDWKLGMMPGTSPAVTRLANGGYEVAFQANTGELWTVGSDARGDWKLGMMAGTSPSIAALPNGGYEVAFQANTGNLWTVGSDAHGDWKLGMMAGTSPAIATLANGGYEVAFQANTGELWTVGSDPNGSWKLGMMAGTSPSIAALPNGGYEVAFQANTGNLWTVGSDAHGDWKLGMMAGTSPAIATLSNGGYEVPFRRTRGICGRSGTTPVATGSSA